MVPRKSSAFRYRQLPPLPFGKRVLTPQRLPTGPFVLEGRLKTAYLRTFPSGRATIPFTCSFSCHINTWLQQNVDPPQSDQKSQSILEHYYGKLQIDRGSPRAWPHRLLYLTLLIYACVDIWPITTHHRWRCCHSEQTWQHDKTRAVL